MTKGEISELKKEKMARKIENITILEKHNVSYSQYDINQSVVFDTLDGAVCFYPTTNKIQHRGKVFPGNAYDVLAYVERIISGCNND
ncbi:hypothetical protein SOASR032_17340 [Pragia fontium]|uniref:Uncharacterized protein n=1 Tax=Pragia fontium TaxID=82985 RepID=A0ABQ5LHS5_9GAMM|nr:hypothetical protein [Pragia fontium]GKX63165.1 hypothetical protein SOASR032_17340 [Pragia fontium]